MSEANIKILWTWASYSRSPNLTNAWYRMLRKEAREKVEGGSFIDTAGLFYAIRNYAINDVEARMEGKTQSNTKHNSTTCRRQCHRLMLIVVTNAESYASARYVSTP